MRRAARTLLTGRMIAVHLTAVALTITMVLLGRWQLDVSNAKHFYWQNFVYAIQWWIFSAFALFVWARVVRDALRTPADDEGAGTSLVLVPRAGQPARPGPALLVDDAADRAHADEALRPARGTRRPRPADPDVAAAPTLYRGYVMPNSAVDHDRSNDDRFRGAYNDQLWQLALADSARGQGPRPTVPRGTIDLEELARRAVPGVDSGSDGPRLLEPYDVDERADGGRTAFGSRDHDDERDRTETGAATDTGEHALRDAGEERDAGETPASNDEGPGRD